MNNYENGTKWQNTIKEILLSVGRPDLWENQFYLTHTGIHKLVKQTLIDQYKQSWQEQLQNTNKGIIYLSFKQSHGFENYFKIITKKDYLPLFKFCTANHFFPVETGRYDATPFNERKCPLCTLDRVGSESHYLLECSYFENKRRIYLSDIVYQNDTNIGSVMTISSAPKLKRIGRFVNIILNKFIS